MENYAGKSNVDKEISDELKIAKIEVVEMPWEGKGEGKGEVKTKIRGSLHGWWFERAWYYWVAKGPGIPPKYANELHKEYGNDVRVDGHCECPSPLEWFKGFSVGYYHVDSQIGLCALADTIRKVANDAKKENEK